MRVFVAGGSGVVGRRPVPQPTNRLRTEGTDHLLAAAKASGVSNFVAQSYAGWNGIRKGGWVKTEEDPLELMKGTAAQAGMEAIRYLEEVVVRAGGTVLRYGWLYGPGATDTLVEAVRKRQFPLVGDSTGYSSWVHLDDAASFSNARARRELGWELRYPSWRKGFKEGL